MPTHHFLEISKSSSPGFTTVRPCANTKDPLTTFELLLLAGVMVHPASTFSIEMATSSVSIEWYQEYDV